MVAARGLELDDKGRGGLEQGQHLVEGRDLLVRALEPELLQLLQRQILNLAVCIRAAPQIGIVEDGERAVLQQVHVQLRAEAVLDGPAEGGEGVFGDDGLVMEAAVRVAVFLRSSHFGCPFRHRSASVNSRSSARSTIRMMQIVSMAKTSFF